MKVTFKDDQGAPTKIVEYAYDFGNRWIRKVLDADADLTPDASRVFVHDGGQIVLDYEGAGGAGLGAGDLAHRYLWGPATDQLLADEAVDCGADQTPGTADDVRWTLGDHLNSVRDWAAYDDRGTATLADDTVTIVKHVVYDAFGNVIADTVPGVESLLLYTARPFDADTHLQNNLNRWYDATIGRWLSVDPIGFAAGDANLYRYVGNAVTWAVDPWPGCERRSANTVPIKLRLVKTH